MSLFKQKGSPFYYAEFEVNGKRVRRATGCTAKRAAKDVERRLRAEANEQAALCELVGATVASLRFADAALRYFEEKRDHLTQPRNIKRELVRLEAHFGAGKLLTDIKTADVQAFVLKRRNERAQSGRGKGKQPVSAGSVNHSVIRLQALFRHAKDEWKATFPSEPNWRKCKLEVSRNTPARIFEGKEKERFDKETRADFQPILNFAYESGKRLAFCVGLKWKEVRWAQGVISKPGKRKPNGEEKIETVAITPQIRAILEPLKGHHREFVFCYVARKTRDKREKGKRYPITASHLQTQFRRICAEGKIEGFGFHSLRRSAATEFFDAVGGDLLLTQRFMNHADAKTTARYIRRDDQMVSAGMEKRAAERIRRQDSEQGSPLKVTPNDNGKAA